MYTLTINLLVILRIYKKRMKLPIFDNKPFTLYFIEEKMCEFTLFMLHKKVRIYIRVRKSFIQ